MSDRASDIFLFPRMSAYFACSFMPKECKDYCVKGNVFRCSGLFWGTSWCMAFTSLCGFFVFEELETHRWENIILSEGCHLNNQIIFAYRTLFNIHLLICHYVGRSKHGRVVSLLNLLFGSCGCDFSQSAVNQAVFASEVCWDNYYDLRVCCRVRSGVAQSLNLKTGLLSSWSSYYFSVDLNFLQDLQRC